MPFRDVAGTFNNDALCAMRDAFDLACDELGLTLHESDSAKRELVAAVIIQPAQSDELNAAVLHRRAVLRLLNSARR